MTETNAPMATLPHPPTSSRPSLTAAEARLVLARRLMGMVDARLQPEQRAEQALAARPPPLRVRPDAQVALVGHRGSGKSRLLTLLSAWCGRKGVDLDRHLEQVHRRDIRAWFTADAPGFRAAERAAFVGLPPGGVVACGGGFLSLHADLLEGHVAVLVPVSFETYCERLSRDKRRPRLRPELTLEEELREVYTEREAQHARTGALDLFAFVARTLDPEGSFG